MLSKSARVALIVVGVSSLVLAGGIVASQIGFKMTIQLQNAGAGPDPGSVSGTNFFSLPGMPKAGLVTARDLFVDIGVTNIQFINKHRRIDDGFEVYTFGGGTLPPNGWNLVPGEGYIVKMGQPVSYLVVGTEAPDMGVTLFGGGAGPVSGSVSGTNFLALPPHAVSTTARELFLEIGGSVQFINQHRKLDDGFEVYTFGGGTVPPNGWDLVRGETIIVKIGGSVQRFTPLHY